jgi:catechol 2,3-dioxygenase-like lactoylglutathione lyase family enzyme
MSIKPHFGFAVEYVPDMEAARHFYADVLGLEVQRTHPTFIQFPNFAIAGDEPLSKTGETELYWLVDDAEAAYAELSRTAEVSLPLRELPFGKVFGIKDPKGEPRYLLQLAQNRPSQAV